ncbi:MAG: bamB 3, partial [Verrucomicrobiales bacterium]|nr:bamB 3 [Verrucomicrobiales bacterium]
SMPDGVVREWLVLGPVPVPDVPKASEKDTLPNELQLAPEEGDKVAGLVWKKVNANSATLDFTALLGTNNNSFAYAHTYLHSDLGGAFVLQFTHRSSTRVVLNGKQAYASDATYAGRINLRLLPGWNRLLVKVSSDDSQWFGIPVLHAHDARGYEEKNILWKTALPGARVYQATPAGPGGPIVVKDKIFVLCEPHDLFCLNRQDGKVLWVRSNSYFDALTESERNSNPAFKQIETMAAQWNEVASEQVGGGEIKTSYEKREKLEKDLYSAMKQVDSKRFNRPTSQDVGYAGFTPVSDGKYVYAWFASGVTACYDLEGNRKWIRIDNHETVEHGFSSSPILAGGKMIVFMRDLMAFDAKTGEEAWRNPIIGPAGMNPGGFFHGSFARAGLAGVETVIPADGTIVRVSDGNVLFKDPRLASKQNVSSPVIDRDVLCIMATMGETLYLLQLPQTATEGMKPAFKHEVKIPTHGFPFYYLGWHIASPLVHQGLVYLMNNAGLLTVVDAQAGSILYQRMLDLDHFETANEGPARGHGISPALAGNYIYFFGNSGAAIVIEPGRKFKQVAKNKIEGLATAGTWGERQDRAVACPFFEGNRIYYRTESALYAIGLQP